MTHARVFEKKINLGHVTLVISVLGSVMAGVWQGSAIRTSLEDAITHERQMREAEQVVIDTRFAEIMRSVEHVRSDLRDLRTDVNRGKR